MSLFGQRPAFVHHKNKATKKLRDFYNHEASLI